MLITESNVFDKTPKNQKTLNLNVGYYKETKLDLNSSILDQILSRLASSFFDAD